jgi:hypothetical protein
MKAKNETCRGSGIADQQDNNDKADNNRKCQERALGSDCMGRAD